MNAQKIPEQKSKALTGVNGDPNKTSLFSKDCEEQVTAGCCISLFQLTHKQ